MKCLSSDCFQIAWQWRRVSTWRAKSELMKVSVARGEERGRCWAVHPPSQLSKDQTLVTLTLRGDKRRRGGRLSPGSLGSWCWPLARFWHLGLGSVLGVRFLLLKFQIQNNKLPWQELTHTPRRREQNLITEHRVTFSLLSKSQQYAKLDTGLEFGVCFSIYSRNYLSDIASE